MPADASYRGPFGGEFGRQSGLNFRQSGFFNGRGIDHHGRSAKSCFLCPRDVQQHRHGCEQYLQAQSWRGLLQDQIEITRYLQFIGGVRFDHFDLQSRDRRTNVALGRVDDLVSPRAGIVCKPMDNLV